VPQNIKQVCEVTKASAAYLAYIIDLNNLSVDLESPKSFLQLFVAKPGLGRVEPLALHRASKNQFRIWENQSQFIASNVIEKTQIDNTDETIYSLKDP
jgi:hypothetical protein